MPLRVVDLFCGIGSFHQAARRLEYQCVFACDIDGHVRKVYEANYGIKPHGDITAFNIGTDIQEHDILCAGFPCQPFSLIGQRKGSKEDRGCLIDYIARILIEKKPRACVLENVKGLQSSNGGADFTRIQTILEAAGYKLFHRILRADDYGIPQMRQRLFIVGIRNDLPHAIQEFKFAEPTQRVTLAQFMGMPFVKASAHTIRCGGRNSGVDDRRNWDSYRLQDGSVHTLTISDCMKLQGFDASTWNWDGVSNTRKLKMLGNTIPTCLSYSVMKSLEEALIHEQQVTETTEALDRLQVL